MFNFAQGSPERSAEFLCPNSAYAIVIGAIFKKQIFMVLVFVSLH